MKKGLLLLFLALSAGTFSACVNESSSDRLEQEQMAQVLADIHIDEALIQNLHVGNSDTSLVLYHELSQQTLKKRGLDSSQVAKSYGSYVKDPAAFIKLYTRVNEIIEERGKNTAVKNTAVKKPAANKP
jgi:Na+-translocating ferredoxin:NAD+ oxidoreductase RnfG subunit